VKTIRLRACCRAAAMKMHDEIVGKADILSTFPKLGRPAPDAKTQKAGFRILVIDPYMAFYKVVGINIFIYRIIHGAMNYPLLYSRAKTSARIHEDFWREVRKVERRVPAVVRK
jgi:plasmid stabilization system protein ParE